MEDTIVKEGRHILNRLSLKNQANFMTLLRLAKAAEDAAKEKMYNQPQKTSQHTR